ncbi:MAG: hypothetical protein NTY61_00330 [Candidatus Parcubacteria bacterium]|nr:hypothetical protein [Candidatus Parcubacteria bacterium]
MDYNKIFQSKAFKIVLIFVVLLIFLLLGFQLGLMVGFKKASFSYEWGDNYHSNFAGPRQGFLAPFGPGDFMDAHGVIGQIAKIDNSTIIIKDRDNLEKIVLVNDKTIINRFRDNIKLSDLRADDIVVIIGDPNNSGQIIAKLIRLLPLPMPPANAPGPH